jgi:hypothetical protein
MLIIFNTNHFQYYTGLPNFDVLITCLLLLETCNMFRLMAKIIIPFVTKVSLGDQDLLHLKKSFFTLVRLRLALPSKDLSRRIDVWESTFSVIFNTCVILIAKEFEQICCMPTVSVGHAKQADCFQNFDNVRVVLDCTEIFSQILG